jgi:hypothetical protein
LQKEDEAACTAQNEDAYQHECTRINNIQVNIIQDNMAGSTTYPGDDKGW